MDQEGAIKKNQKIYKVIKLTRPSFHHRAGYNLARTPGFQRTPSSKDGDVRSPAIDRLFPSDGPAGRTSHDGCSATFKRVRTRCGAKASGDLEQVS